MKRRKMLLGMGTVAGGGSILGTGAFTSVEADRSASVAVADDEDAFLRLAPCTDDNGNVLPNGEYVQAENGVLTLDLTGDNPTNAGGQGVNADATSRFDNVFEIRNQGTQPIGVWLEAADAATAGDVDGDGHDEPRIEFYRADDPSTEIVEDGSSLNAKCLDVGESVCVGFIIRTQGLSSGDDETHLFDGSPPGSDGEELVVNADVDVACDVPSGGGGGSTDALYVADTGDGELASDQTTLYSADLSTGPNQAGLTELTQQDSTTNFARVGSLAATPDGDFLYIYDADTAHLGEYDVANGIFTDLGEVQNDPGGIVLGAFKPNGELWVASQQNNTLYVVEDYDSSPTINQQEGITVDLSGADIAFTFTPDSTLYLWSSEEGDDGLYKLDPEVSNPTAQAITNPPGSITGRDLTGIALKDPQGSTLLGSDKQQSEIVEIDTATGTIVDSYNMLLGGSDYNLGFGDLASPTSVNPN